MSADSVRMPNHATPWPIPVPNLASSTKPKVWPVSLIDVLSASGWLRWSLRIRGRPREAKQKTLAVKLVWPHRPQSGVKHDLAAKLLHSRKSESTWNYWKILFNFWIPVLSFCWLTFDCVNRPTLASSTLFNHPTFGTLRWVNPSGHSSSQLIDECTMNQEPFNAESTEDSGQPATIYIQPLVELPQPEQPEQESHPNPEFYHVQNYVYSEDQATTTTPFAQGFLPYNYGFGPTLDLNMFWAPWSFDMVRKERLKLSLKPFLPNLNLP